VKNKSICGSIKVPREGADTMQYSKELKESIIRKMLPPNSESISKISKEEGISEQTLRNWRDNARAKGMAAPGNTNSKLALFFRQFFNRLVLNM
jgi:transposase-like protein